MKLRWCLLIFVVVFLNVYFVSSQDFFCSVAGDVNGDGRVDISDAVNLLNHLFRGFAQPNCWYYADVNADGNVNEGPNVDLSDAIYLLRFLFQGGPAPAAPVEIDTVDDPPYLGESPTEIVQISISPATAFYFSNFEPGSESDIVSCIATATDTEGNELILAEANYDSSDEEGIQGVSLSGPDYSAFSFLINDQENQLRLGATYEIYVECTDLAGQTGEFYIDIEIVPPQEDVPSEDEENLFCGEFDTCCRSSANQLYCLQNPTETEGLYTCAEYEEVLASENPNSNAHLRECQTDGGICCRNPDGTPYCSFTTQCDAGDTRDTTYSSCGGSFNLEEVSQEQCNQGTQEPLEFRPSGNKKSKNIVLLQGVAEEPVLSEDVEGEPCEVRYITAFDKPEDVSKIPEEFNYRHLTFNYRHLTYPLWVASFSVPFADDGFGPSIRENTEEILSFNDHLLGRNYGWVKGYLWRDRSETFYYRDSYGVVIFASLSLGSDPSKCLEAEFGKTNLYYVDNRYTYTSEELLVEKSLAQLTEENRLKKGGFPFRHFRRGYVSCDFEGSKWCLIPYYTEPFKFVFSLSDRKKHILGKKSQNEIGQTIFVKPAEIYWYEPADYESTTGPTELTEAYIGVVEDSAPRTINVPRVERPITSEDYEEIQDALVRGICKIPRIYRRMDIRGNHELYPNDPAQVPCDCELQFKRKEPSNWERFPGTGHLCG